MWTILWRDRGRDKSQQENKSQMENKSMNLKQNAFFAVRVAFAPCCFHSWLCSSTSSNNDKQFECLRIDIYITFAVCDNFCGWNVLVICLTYVVVVDCFTISHTFFFRKWNGRWTIDFNIVCKHLHWNERLCHSLSLMLRRKNIWKTEAIFIDAGGIWKAKTTHI